MKKAPACDSRGSEEPLSGCLVPFVELAEEPGTRVAVPPPTPFTLTLVMVMAPAVRSAMTPMLAMRFVPAGSMFPVVSAAVVPRFENAS